MKIHVVTPFSESDWRWFGDRFDGHEWRFENLSLFGRKPWFWLFEAISVARRHGGADLVISHHPYMSFYLGLAHLLLRLRVRHHSFSFNHGNGRFFKGMLRTLAKVVFSRISGFVVFSNQERKIYSEYYNIPKDKMYFVHWAVNPPDVSGGRPGYIDDMQPYVCCMGRNNRDFDSFVAAVDRLGVKALIVCPPGQVAAEGLPETVRLLHDIPMKEAMQILAGAWVSVTPLKDASTGAGHITIVSALQLGIPQILTRLSTVEDYFCDGVHGCFVEQGDVDSLAEALRKLMESESERARISQNARSFAAKWLNEEASKRHLSSYLSAVGNGGIPSVGPPGWNGM